MLTLRRSNTCTNWATLKLLAVQFDTIWIPATVVCELEVGQTLGQDLPELSQVARLKVLEPTEVNFARGEDAAIALAKELQCIVLLDDLRARAKARREGLVTVGVLGILLAGERRGMVPDLRSCLERLPSLGFRLSDTTVAEVLRLSGEQHAAE